MSGIQVGWGEQWEILANAINSYYGGSVSSTQYQQVVQMLNSGNYTMEEMESILQHIPEFNRTYNAAGQLTGVSYKAVNAGNTTAGAAANAVNSNAANAVNSQFSTVQNITKDAQTNRVTISDNVVKYKTGQLAPTTAKSVLGSTISAVAAASVGIKAGKAIDSVLYNLNPDFWDDNNMSSLNPETWGSITAGDNSTGAKLFNWVFCIDPETNNPEPYLDANTFAYMLAYMGSMGVFNTGAGSVSPDPDHPLDITPAVAPVLLSNRFYSIQENVPSSRYEMVVVNGARFAIFCRELSNAYQYIFFLTSKTQGALVGERYISTMTTPINIYATDSFTYNGKTVYYTVQNTSLPKTQPVTDGNINNIASAFNATGVTNTAWVMEYGAYSGGGGVEGITDQQGATVFDGSSISDWSNIAAVLAALLAQYPELWDNRIEVSPDGDNTYVYLPASFPTGGVDNQPTTDGAAQGDTAIDIDTSTDELIKTLIDMLQNPQDQNGMESDTDTPTEPIDPNMPNGGSGITPPFVIPTGSASALYSVYNPSQGQLNSLGAWLWSSNFVDQLLKLFNDPMQAIIGLHKIFATPPTSGTGTIKVGYLDSGVGSNLVSAQYTEVDCGTVTLNEYFKNALDYLKTDIYLYLPFVGIVPLNVEDVTRASINVKYKVDVLTGACLASVYVTRDAGGGGQLYVYAGNCAVQYPLSSGSYMGIVAGVLGIAGGVASSVLSGGALLPMALGAGASAMNSMKTKVEHSGSLSGNSGAMGIKKPYLIIRRPQTKIADNFQLLAGESQNEYGVLSSYTGQTRVKYVHLENIPATDKELTQIEELLKSGVLI